MLLLVALTWVSGTSARDELIPMAQVRQPSRDLIYQGSLITAERAWQLQNDSFNPVDLSLLDPEESAVWNNNIQSVLDTSIDQIPINEEEEYLFKGTILSNQGILRFNVLPAKSKDRVFTLLLEKTLHTALLRKNLLRKLGYQIPAMKYLKKVKITFDSKAQRDKFLAQELPNATYGAPSRWIKKDHTKLDDNELTLTFHDVAAFLPLETDHYNVAMGVPPRNLVTRTLRSLLVPYALLNLGESVNKFPWSVGKIQNENLVLPHYYFSAINPTINDVRWAVRRLALLGREDFKEVVENAYFPKAVELVLIEKLISRRNSLLNLLEEEGKEIPFNTELSFGEDLKKGQLQKEDWEGYASRFAHGEPDSPFKDFQYFIFNKLQNATLQNLLDVVNEKLQAFDPSEKKLEFAQNQFQEGLTHFVETGEFKEFGIGTWFSPIANGNLIMSRDIVIGNYLGTDNLVQLADTVGLSVTLGGILGIENVPQWPIASATATITGVRTYTHLKPVKTLKATFKEPYKNVIVPLMKMKLRKTLDELAQIPSQDAGEVGEGETDPRLEKIQELISVVDSQLGVGESLLVTDRLTPSALVRGSFNMMETRVSMSTGASGVMLRRLHLHRKDASTIHVYEDRGHGLTLTVSASIDHYIPVLKISAGRTKGKYKVKMHQVNINSDLEENPNLFVQAKALHHLLEDGSSELLTVNEKPYEIEGDFLDKSVKFSFLVWRSKYLSGDNEITVTTPTQNRTEYVSLTTDSQSGINYQAFTYDVLNYYLKEWTRDLPITPQLDPETFKNPGQSIFGVSETVSGRYEARKIDGQLQKPFLSLSTRREGWSASTKKLKNYIKKINEQYGRPLFNERDLDNAAGLKLFDISVSTNVYEKGIKRLESVKGDDIREISRRYARDRRPQCGEHSRSRRIRIRTASTFRECQNLNVIVDKAEECQQIQRKEGQTKSHAKCVLELSKKLVRDLQFEDFLSLVGLENIYVYGGINGFRKDSEILNDPIPANTIGKIRDRNWNGPLERVKEIIGIQGGEFHGKWIRESL